MIPKIIHQFWDKPTPAKDVAERMDSWPTLHPGWQYKRWNDESAAEFIFKSFGRDAVVAFLSAKIPAMRSDIARLAVILHYGGFYLDSDWVCRRPLDDLLENHGVLRYRPSRPGRSKRTAERSKPIKLSNGFLGAEPGNVLFERAFDQVVKNIKKFVYSLRLTKVAGPVMLTDVWHWKLNDEERASFKLISKLEFDAYLRRLGALEYREEGQHWTADIKRRMIIDIDVGKEALSKLGLRADRPA